MYAIRSYYECAPTAAFLRTLAVGAVALGGLVDRHRMGALRAGLGHWRIPHRVLAFP